MSEDTTRGPATPSRVPCNDQLGPMPRAAINLDGYGGLKKVHAYTEDQMRSYAAEQVAAERERWRSWVEEAVNYVGCKTWSPSLKEEGERLLRLRA